MSRAPKKIWKKILVMISDILRLKSKMASEIQQKISFFKINSKISIFKPCNTYKKVSGHRNEQLLHFTVFCGTNCIKVMAILRCLVGPRMSKLWPFWARKLENIKFWEKCKMVTDIIFGFYGELLFWLLL